jgi:hypothetical protein
VPFLFMWVRNRAPKQKLCVGCQQPLTGSGYIHDPGTCLNYCSPECLDVHRTVTENHIASYSTLEDAARRVS